MTIVEKIIQSPELPDILKQLNRAYTEEQKKRKQFYAKITPSDKAEFINGKIVMHSPATNKHLVISNLLSRLLSIYCDNNDLGQIFIEKAMITLKRNDFEPDICFFKKERAAEFDSKTLLFPAPDLVVEILSKSTHKNDRGIKFVDYALNGIPEYWIIDPENEIVEQYLLDGNKYTLQQKTKDGIVKCYQILGLEFPVRAIFDKSVNQEFIKTKL